MRAISKVMHRLAVQGLNDAILVKNYISCSWMLDKGACVFIVSIVYSIQGAREISNHFWDNVNFCLFIVGNLKDLVHRTMNRHHMLETQWTALCWGSRTVLSMLLYRSPNTKTIRDFINTFQWTGNICDEKRSGRSLTSQETMETIRQAIKQSQEALTRHFSREHSIPKSTVWQTLHFVLQKKVYHIQVLNHLESKDYVAHMAICHDLIEAVHNEHLLAYALFSDDSTFHTCDLVNRHNSRIWADEQPYIAMELEHNIPKVKVLLKQQSKSTSYLDMLEQFLQPQLFADILDSVVLQQDGTPPHFAHTVHNYLNETFLECWIGWG